MARPRYENATDVHNEISAAEKFASLFRGAELTRASDEARGFTFLSKGGKSKIVLEIKTRTNSSVKYPTFMISKGKYDALCEWAERGLTAGLLVQWTDKLGFVCVPVKHTTSVGGRYDRGDPRDIETVVLIETSLFERVQDDR
jgi:hypothetical protein